MTNKITVYSFNLFFGLNFFSDWSVYLFCVSIPFQEEEQDPLIHGLYILQELLNNASSLATMDAITFLKPFCDIIQSDDTTGPITGMAITSLDKFLAYGLIGEL